MWDKIIGFLHWNPSAWCSFQHLQVFLQRSTVKQNRALCMNIVISLAFANRIFQCKNKKERPKEKLIKLHSSSFKYCNILAFGSNPQQICWCLLYDHRLALVLAKIIMKIRFRTLPFQPHANTERSRVARVLVSSGVRAATPYGYRWGDRRPVNNGTASYLNEGKVSEK